MSVPDEVRETLKQKLWSLADSIGWMNISTPHKAKHYEEWTRDTTIGGILGRYLDGTKVRVYIKDTLLKEYARSRLADPRKVFRILGVTEDSVEMTFIKPHGRILKDGRVICWGRADDWKGVLLAVHERTSLRKSAQPHAAVLLQATGRFHEVAQRAMVQSASNKLGIEKLIWVEA